MCMNCRKCLGTLESSWILLYNELHLLDQPVFHVYICIEWLVIINDFTSFDQKTITLKQKCNTVTMHSWSMRNSGAKTNELRHIFTIPVMLKISQFWKGSVTLVSLSVATYSSPESEHTGKAQSLSQILKTNQPKRPLFKRQ